LRGRAPTRFKGRLGLVLLACAAPTAGSAQTANAEAWQQDLAEMVHVLETRHPDLYHSVSRTEFHQATAELTQKIPTLDDYQIIVEMARLVARVSDGHTLVPLLWDRDLPIGRLPLELYKAEDGMVVLAADAEYEHLVGNRVVRIGETLIEDAVESVTRVVSRDNLLAVRNVGAYLGAPEVLSGLGIISDPQSVDFLMEDEHGRLHRHGIVRVSKDAALDWRTASALDSLPLWLQDREDRYWFKYLEDRRTVYLQFNGADFDKEEESLAEFGHRLVGFVEEEDVERLVIDLRWNDGGSRWRARHLLNSIIRVEGLLGDARSTRSRRLPGKIFTIIGPVTFSAATQFALDLELHTNTVFVGEPTGGKPNHFSEVGRFRLTNGGLEVRHSVFYHQASHPRDTRPAIFPDIRSPLTTGDIRTSTDPALEAIWGFGPRASLRDSLRAVIEEHAVPTTIAEYQRIKREHYNEFDFTNAQRALNRIGYELLQNDRPEDAVAIFRLNLDEYPWSANAHDSLADGYLAQGMSQEALQHACEAFRIDAQYTKIIELGWTADCPVNPRRRIYSH